MLPDRGRTANGGRQTGPGTREAARPGGRGLRTSLHRSSAGMPHGRGAWPGNMVTMAPEASGTRRDRTDSGPSDIGRAVRRRSTRRGRPSRQDSPPAGADRPARALVLMAGHSAGNRGDGNQVDGTPVGRDAFRRGSVSVAGPGGGRAVGPAATGSGTTGPDGRALPTPGRVWPRRPLGQVGGRGGRTGGGSGRLPQRRLCPSRPFAFPRQRVLVGSRYGAATASIRNGCPIRPASLVIDRPRKGVPTRTPADWSRGGPPRARAGFIPDARRADVTDVGSGQESYP